MSVRQRLIATLAIAGGFAAMIIFWAVIARTMQMFFGFRNGDGNGSHYLFWSGSGSNLAYLSTAAAVVIYYRKNNCKRAWCPFLGNYDFTDPEDGVNRKLCWVHHPDVRHKTLRTEHIQAIQQKRHLYLGKNPGKG